jgi:hypothetical protein
MSHERYDDLIRWNNNIAAITAFPASGFSHYQRAINIQDYDEWNDA